MRSAINTLREYDVPVTVNADAPVFLETNVANEFDLLIEHDVIKPEDVRIITEFAKNASFIDKNVLY